MPGNEVGEKIHNFIGQEILSQGQHHSHVIDGSWPGLSNNLYVGSQRQLSGPLVSSLKNFDVHQLAESDKGHGGQSISLLHGLNFNQSDLRPEVARSQSQNQSSIVNGYMQGHQSFQASQNEANFLGVGSVSRGFSGLDSHIGNGPDLHKNNLLRLESTDSPLIYDCFGGQQQISGPNHSMIQPLPRQQAGMADVQLLQQHAMLKQIQELQWQQLSKQQLQLPEARQLSSTNQVPSVVNQGSSRLTPAPINGVPVHDASNYSCQPEHMTASANWLQHSALPVIQGSSSGFMFSPEQGQGCLMGLVPQPGDQTCYGISTGGDRGNPYLYSSVQMDKPLMQVQASGNYFLGNQYAVVPNQVGLQDESLISRQGDSGKNLFVPAADQGLNSEFILENLQQMTIQPKNVMMQESRGGQGYLGPLETSVEKSVIQVAPAQTVATLDPTEEKILFGLDDNEWDIFGKSANRSSPLDGSDTFGAFPSLQSGSWSALMQSAVAETSSNDIGVQEWCGLAVQNRGTPSAIMPSSVVNNSSKQESSWADSNLRTFSAMNSKAFSMSTDANIDLDFCNVPGVQQSGVKTANERSGRMHNDPSQKFVKQSTDERGEWLDQTSVQKPVVEGTQLFGNVAYSPIMQASAMSSSSHHQVMAAHCPHGRSHDKQNGCNIADSESHGAGALSKIQDIKSSLQLSKNGDQRGVVMEKGHGSSLDHPIPNGNIEPDTVNSSREGSDVDNIAEITNSKTINITKESSQQLPNSRNFNTWRSVDTKVRSGLSGVPAKYLQNLDRSPQAFDPSGSNCLNKGVSETNPNVRETSNESFPTNLPQHPFTGGMRGKQFAVLEAMPALETSATSESLQQDALTRILRNVWTSVSAPQHLLGAKTSWPSQNLLNPNHHSAINSETTHPGAKKLDDQIAMAGRSGPSEFPAGSAKPQSSVEEEQSGKAQQVLPENDASHNSATIQRDIEAFGCSLRPNTALHQNYSLLHQVQAMNNMDIDPGNRSVKRFKGPDSGLDAQQIGAEQLRYGSDTMMRGAPVNHPLVPSGDSKVLCFSSKSRDNRETQLSSNDVLAFSRNDFQHTSNANNSAANVRSEHSQITPQMASSWFDQYGTFKSGQMLPVHDAQKIAMAKATEKSFIGGRPSDSLHEQVNAAAVGSQLVNAQQSPDLMPIATGHISSHLLPQDIQNQNLAVVRAKKRKSVTFELLAWHRELTQGSERPQNISAAEVEWAYAANRLIEKVEDEPEMIEDWQPVLRSKRRLVLTTQLMQHVFRAPPRVVLSADASKNSETVAYFVARSVLGDACSTACIPESSTAVPPDCGSTISEKLKKERKQLILKAAEEISFRAKKLENDLLSLDKRTSILDLRVECQDLEKFSVINRFAKLHGRGQAEGAQTLSSAGAITSSQKLFPQRYVTALQMPRNLPDRDKAHVTSTIDLTCVTAQLMDSNSGASNLCTKTEGMGRTKA